MEQLRQLRHSVDLANSRIDSLNEGVRELKDHFEDITHDLNTFIDVYEASQNKVDTRLTRIEEHIGLSGQ